MATNKRYDSISSGRGGSYLRSNMGAPGQPTNSRDFRSDDGTPRLPASRRVVKAIAHEVNNKKTSSIWIFSMLLFALILELHHI
jgi:hypothetical protein